MEDQFIQGGDFIFGNGTGGESIYGEIFKDESFSRRHACAGLLSMANKGRNTNSSQFFITLKPCPHLDGKHVVFGQVIGGMDVVRQIAKVPTDIREKPKLRIVVYDCGDYNTKRIHNTEDPFKDMMNKIAEDRKLRELVQTMGEDEAEEFKRKKFRSNFEIIQEYDSDKESKIQTKTDEKLIQEVEPEPDNSLSRI